MADKTNNIYINGEQATKTLRELRGDARKLNNEVQQLVPGTEAYNKKVKELGQTKAQLTNHAKEVRNVGNAMATANKTAADRLAELNKTMQSGSVDARQMQRALVEYQTIALEAGRTSPVGQQAIKDAAHYQDMLTDIKNEITRVSHDGANMQAALQLGATVIGGYAVAKGAMSALGLESEELQETFVKLQAATAALNGIEQIRQNLEKESFLMIKAKAVQQNVLTGATAAYTAVVGASTGALKLFRLALMATGIGAIVVGIGMLIANFSKVNTFIKDTIKWFNGLGEGVKLVISILLPFIGMIRLIVGALESLGVVEDEQAKARRKHAAEQARLAAEERKRQRELLKERIKNLEKERKAIEEKAEFEIAKLRAAGKDTVDIERQKMEAVLESNRKQIDSIEKLVEELRTEMRIKALSGQFVLDEINQVNQLLKKRAELKDSIKETSQNLEIFEISQRKKASDARQKNHDDQLQQQEEFLKSLEELKAKEIAINEERNREVFLANKSAQEAEIIQSQWAVEEKYKEDIAKAKELANQKGEIGARGAERLASLEALMAEELVNEKLKIEAQYRKDQEKIEAKAAADRLKVQEEIEDAIHNTRIAKLQHQLELTGQYEVEKRKEILKELADAEKTHAQMEADRQLQDLEERLENELITREEFNILKHQQEVDLEAQLLAIRQKSAEDQIALSKQTWDMAQQFAAQAITAIDQLQDNRFNKQLDSIERGFNAEQNLLNNNLESGKISREQYNKKIEALEKDKAAKEHEIAVEQFKAEQRMNLIKASMNLAQAIMQAIAQFGPPPSPQGTAAIALAGVIGGAQIGAIKGQKPPEAPQFAEGGFTKVKGASDGKTYNAKYGGRQKAGMIGGGPQLVLVNEKAPEYFIPNPMLNNPAVIDHVRAIESIRVRQFNDGGFTNQSASTNSTGDASSVDANTEIMTQLLRENMQVIKELYSILPNLRVVIGDESIDNIFDRRNEIEEIRN